LSEIGHILAASVPQKPVFISATIVNDKVKIAWQMPYNSASLITKAMIRIAKSDGSGYVEDTVNCDGANNALFDARQCLYNLSVLTLGPYSLVQGNPILPQIKFSNEIGWSDYSAVVTSPTLMQAKPHVPSVLPVKIAILTSGTQMGIRITALSGTATGGAPILSYNLQKDQAGGGSGPWSEVVGETTNQLQTEITINYLTGGKTYYFRYRAKNAHGWGLPGLVSAYLMASRPDKMSTPATTSNVGASVQVIWPASPNV